MKIVRLFTPLMVGILLLIGGCGGEEENPYADLDLKQLMRDFVIDIGDYAHSLNPDFILIPQNGGELLTANGESDGDPAWDYLGAIQGVGREDLFYGYVNDNQPTPQYETEYMLDFLEVAQANGKTVLVTDYCWLQSYINDSYQQNAAHGFISFAANQRELDNIPPYPVEPYNVNSDTITDLTQAKNFLYLLNPSSYPDKTAYLNALMATDYDILIIDLFFEGDSALSAAEVAGLKVKTNGGSRLVIAYMSIGEAEDYRWYWQNDWEVGSPEWIVAYNPYWGGNYKVEYWNPEWQSIIFGNDESYTKKLIDAGFDGAYLDIVDAFEYFENQ